MACISLRALACLQNASVLWSRHRPAGGGGWREERWAVRREEWRQEGTAAVWASSLLARLLKVIIEFLCRASPPCGILLCSLRGRRGVQERQREKLAACYAPLQWPYMQQMKDNFVWFRAFARVKTSESLVRTKSSHTCERPHSCSTAAKTTAQLAVVLGYS